ncbi:hypothetical protein [Paraburkholderia bonniea]|uniref:hypothetical protein n=1 Tax=Paraburkholderia bonniea TaxID=2152891 RepID=UPI00129108C6|nr:hypothetical protein [Paraburkholderia bonniea]
MSRLLINLPEPAARTLHPNPSPEPAENFAQSSWRSDVYPQKSSGATYTSEVFADFVAAQMVPAAALPQHEAATRFHRSR